MDKYLNLSGLSNIDSFEIQPSSILVMFYNCSKVYKYTYNSASKEKVEIMKSLATRGSGLNSYINRYAKFDYEK